MSGNFQEMLEYIVKNMHSESPPSVKHKNYQVRIPIHFFEYILPKNYRPGKEDRDLTESIKAFGMIQDPVLNLDREKEEVTIIDGEHRIISAIQAEQPFIDVTFYEGITPLTFREMQLDSNAGKEKIAVHEISKKALDLHNRIREKEETISISVRERVTALSTILERKPSTVRDYLTYEENVPEHIKEDISQRKGVMTFKDAVLAARNLKQHQVSALYEKIRLKKQKYEITTPEEVRQEIRKEIIKANYSFELQQPKNNCIRKTTERQINQNNKAINEFISFYEANKHLAQVLPSTDKLRKKIRKVETQIKQALDDLLKQLPEDSEQKMQRAYEKLDSSAIRRKVFKKLLNTTEKPRTQYYAIEEVEIGPNIRKEIHPESIDDLAISITQHGQLQSGIITDGEKAYEVVTGQRRRRAIDHANENYDANITHFKAKHYPFLDELQRSTLQIHEDVHKPDSKQERAKALYELFHLKKQENTEYKEKQFLQDYKRLNNKGDISKEFAFNFIDPILQEMVHARVITFDRAFHLERELKSVKETHETKYEEFRNKVLYNVLTKKMPDRKIKNYLEQEKNLLSQTTLFEEASSYQVAEEQLEQRSKGIIQKINQLTKKEKIGKKVTRRQSFYDGLAKLYLSVN